MDFSKLNSNERLAAYGAIASIIGGLITLFSYSAGSGLLLTLLLGVAMLAVVFMPQFSPTTQLPGSKGTLMLIIGGIAALGALLGLIALLSLLGLMATFAGFLAVALIALLLGIAGGFMMGWGGWQEFQAEGGKFQLGNAAAPSSTPPPASSSTATGDVPAATPPPAPAAPTTPSAPPTAPAPSSDTEMDNRP
jgi:hypothetical protein